MSPGKRASGNHTLIFLRLNSTKVKNQTQLKAGLIAFILSLFAIQYLYGQGDMFTAPNFNSSPEIEEEMMQPYITIYGDVINSDVRRDKVEIQVFMLDDSTCTWHKIEHYTDNEFYLLLERGKEYQVWFNNGSKYKILYVDPGYIGNYAYRINANFTKDGCARMTPSESGKRYFVDYISHSELKSLAYNSN